MMCHLIATTSPYHTLLVPHNTVQGERGQEKKGERERERDLEIKGEGCREIP